MGTATTQGQAESPVSRVIDHVAAERFTGLLRVRAREADGELWFLAGIRQEARFGTSKGDEAVDRMLRANEVVFDAEQRLPALTGGFKTRMPTTGSFADVLPVTLMRYCETFALTCVLHLVGTNRTARITYRTGELILLDAGSGGDDTLPSLLESEDGRYQFDLPSFELPQGVKTASTAPRAGAMPATALSVNAALPGKPSLADRVDLSLADENDIETKRPAELAAEAKRQAEAEAEALRRAEAEAQRKREEAKRNAEAEARRQADAEARRKADAEAETTRGVELAQRQADAEARRKADAEAETTRGAEMAKLQADAEAKQKAGAQREAEAMGNVNTAARTEGGAKSRAGSRPVVDAGGSLAQASGENPPAKSADRTPMKAAAMEIANRGAAPPAAPSMPLRRSAVWVWWLLALTAAAVAYFFAGNLR